MSEVPVYLTLHGPKQRQRARHRLPRAQLCTQPHALANRGFCVACSDALVKRGAEGEEGARTRGVLLKDTLVRNASQF